MIVDFYLVKKTNINSKEIFSFNKDSSFFYSNGWHIKAIYSLFIGFIFAASTIWNQSLMNLQTYSWLIGAFMSALTYYLLVSK